MQFWAQTSRLGIEYCCVKMLRPRTPHVDGDTLSESAHGAEYSVTAMSSMATDTTPGHKRPYVSTQDRLMSNSTVEAAGRK